MGKKSLIKSTSKKQSSEKGKIEEKKTVKTSAAPAKKAAPAKQKKAAPAKQKKAAPAKQKKAAPVKKTAAKAKVPPAVGAKKSPAVKDPRGLLLEKFDVWKPKKPYKPSKPKQKDFDSPPFIKKGLDEKENRRMKELLFEKFDTAAMKKAAVQRPVKPAEQSPPPLVETVKPQHKKDAPLMDKTTGYILAAFGDTG